MKSQAENIMTLLGRFFMSVIFIIAGFNKIMEYEATVHYITAGGLPYPEFAIIVAIVIELVGGLLLLIGWQTRLMALLISVFVVFITFGFHDFWVHESLSAQALQMQMFLKDFAVLGGLFYIIVYGAGGYSLDARKKK